MGKSLTLEAMLALGRQVTTWHIVVPQESKGEVTDRLPGPELPGDPQPVVFHEFEESREGYQGVVDGTTLTFVRASLSLDQPVGDLNDTTYYLVTARRDGHRIGSYRGTDQKGLEAFYDSITPG